jgi:hypothetical protein
VLRSHMVLGGVMEVVARTRELCVQAQACRAYARLVRAHSAELERPFTSCRFLHCCGRVGSR